MQRDAYDHAVIDGWLTEDRDAWTRRVISRNFDEEAGAPYWIRRREELSFDPMSITTFAELTQFGPFDIDALRNMDPMNLVPRAAGTPLSGRVWETGGTTGKPCRVFLTDDTVRERGIWKRYTLVRDGFELERNWLQATPTGPHIVGNSIAEVTEQYPYAHQVHTIDMDPRWVKAMLRAGNLPVANAYTDHLIQQIMDILLTQEIHYLCTTPALFSVLIDRHSPEVGKLEGVQLVGTRVTADMRTRFSEALDGGIVSLWYGNTLFGIAPALPDADADMMPYVPPHPQVQFTVVDLQDWTSTVPYGETGQVRLTILQDDLFLPNILDRDQAVRYDTGDRWPCDGVAQVAPLWMTQSTPEGVY